MSDGKIACAVCGARVHSIQVHLKEDHPDMTVQSYREAFPSHPLLSDIAKKRLDQRLAAKAAEAAVTPEAATAIHPHSAPTPTTKIEMAASATVTSLVPYDSVVQQPFHTVFDLGTIKAAMSSQGKPIPISVITNPSAPDMIPEVSEAYVFNPDELKNVILAIEMNIPCYVWGHKGSGKSELYEQVAARTGRAYMRVQHTVNTEESHIVGQWTVRDGSTHFELGPLPMAMKNGLVYCADEYDFALPSVLSVYQAVLEGKSLMIKEADAANRIIKPHPNFRFVATGNTNGSGDESGLYQGTQIQNAANYDRFGMVIHKNYLAKPAEIQILIKRVGLVKEDAEKMVEFATLVRDAFDGGKISDVISPRTLIYAARIGMRRASFLQGVALSFTNKLCKVDREVVGGIAQRVFGA
jgi:cobaltochelatase CobS